jgi:hypothetical protein
MVTFILTCLGCGLAGLSFAVVQMLLYRDTPDNRKQIATTIILSWVLLITGLLTIFVRHVL